MEKKAAYEGLAEWFEYLNDDCGYEKWSQYLISKLKCFPLTTGLDVGCGSGWFTRAFRRAGYDMAGLDLSPAMLSRAEALTFEEGLKIRYLQGDVARFRGIHPEYAALLVHTVEHGFRISQIHSPFFLKKSSFCDTSASFRQNGKRLFTGL